MVIMERNSEIVACTRLCKQRFWRKNYIRRDTMKEIYKENLNAWQAEFSIYKTMPEIDPLSLYSYLTSR